MSETSDQHVETEGRRAGDMDAGQEDIARRVAKLLTLAARAGSPDEAASAAAKAQEMLAAYNLDMATVEKAGSQAGNPASGKREDAKTSGGQYQYQRDLWRSVAELNFCLYFNTEQKMLRAKRQRCDWTGKLIDIPKYFYQRQHRIVGRTINTAATRTMAAYLEQAIERRCRQRYPHQSQFFSRDAVSFRKGMAANLVGRLGARRSKLLAEEKRREEERIKNSGVARDTAISLAVYQDKETDANMDFLKGEGWSARQASLRAERAAKLAEEEARYAKWAAENPEEAAAERKREQEESDKYWRRRRGGRRSYSAREDGNQQAFYAGYDAADDISLDAQVDGGSQSAGLLR